MKNFWIPAAYLVLLGVCSTPAAAQPILNRVEQLLRDQISDAAKQGQPAEPGYLGMIGDDSTSGGRGVNVVEVYPGQAAATAGLRSGDLVTRIDGREVRSMDDMAAVLADKVPGAKLAFTVQRGGAAKELRVTLGKRSASDAPAANELPAPDPSPPSTSPAATTSLSPPAQPSVAAPTRPRLGVRTVPVTPEVQRQHKLPEASGAHVISVTIDSPAAKAGIPLGSVITAIDDVPVRSPEDLAAAVRAADQRDVQLTFVQAGRSQKVTANFGTLILTPVGPPAPGPQLETRARPPAPSPVDTAAAPAASPPPPVQTPTPKPPTPQPPTAQFPTAEPSAIEPPAAELPTPDPSPAPEPSGDDNSRIEALERRVAELEERIKTLEEKLPKE